MTGLTLHTVVAAAPAHLVQDLKHCGGRGVLWSDVEGEWQMPLPSDTHLLSTPLWLGSFSPLSVAVHNLPTWPSWNRRRPVWFGNSGTDFHLEGVWGHSVYPEINQARGAPTQSAPTWMHNQEGPLLWASPTILQTRAQRAIVPYFASFSFHWISK